jgi:hypothetical protein
MTTDAARARDWVATVETPSRQPESTFGGAGEQFEIFSVFRRQRFMTLKSDEATKMIGIAVGGVWRGPVFLGGGRLFFCALSAHTAPLNGTTLT